MIVTHQQERMETLTAIDYHIRYLTRIKGDRIDILLNGGRRESRVDWVSPLDAYDAGGDLLYRHLDCRLTSAKRPGSCNGHRTCYTPLS